jgi:hypothetical protein
MGGKAAGATKFVEPMLFSVLAGRTDTNGLVRFTLGHSAQQPYRIRLDVPCTTTIIFPSALPHDFGYWRRRGRIIVVEQA